MLLNERWRGYGHRSWSRGRCFLAGVAPRIACLVVVVVGTLALLPTGAWAEPVCTDTWTGANEGTWQTASNWSTGKVPSSTDVACIGSGKTVKVNEKASAVTGVLSGEGSLILREATLEIASALEPSSIKSLTLGFAATLTGAATVNVTSSLSWLGGTMSGAGSTVLQSGGSGSIEFGVTLNQRKLVNDGTLSFPANYLTMEEGAVFENAGTFNDNSEGPGIAPEGSGAAPSIVNIGTWRKNEGTGTTLTVPAIDNEGTISAGSGRLEFRGGGTSDVKHVGSWLASSGAEIILSEGSYSLGATVPLSGAITLTDNGGTGASVTAGVIEGSTAQLAIKAHTGKGSKLELTGAGTSHVASLTVDSRGILTGPSTLDVAESLTWEFGELSGIGATVLQPGGTGTIRGGPTIAKRKLVNEGVLTFSENYINMQENAVIENLGTFEANAEGAGLGGEGATEGVFVNTGTFEKTVGAGVSLIMAEFRNYGSIRELTTGRFEFKRGFVRNQEEEWGGGNPSAANQEQSSECGEGVNCATGNLSESQTDFAIGGRGVGLDLTRTYNSQAAAKAILGAFGYGWSSSFGDHLVVEGASKKATLHQANGSIVPFTEGPGGAFTAPEWSQDILSGTSVSRYTLTLGNQTVYKFAGATGRLESVTDRNGNATTLTYNESGQLTIITDPASRMIKLTYNGEGLVESAEDPLKHVVKYTYKEKQLVSVTQPAEAGLRWQFEYDGSHQLTELTDGRGNKSSNVYTNHQVTKQTDRLKRETTFEYKTFFTKTKNAATGAETLEEFTSGGQANSITHGYGTSFATTETRKYDSGGDLTSVTDGNGHTTKYGYDGHSNRISMVDPNNHETKWTYNSTHDIETETKPNEEKTTYKRDSHGNPEVIERPAPESKTQATKYKYDTHGNVESMEDPLKRLWKYEYDTAGDKTTEIDPETDKRTWGYNEDSQETSMVSPRGHVKAGEEAKYTTKTERDAQGRAVKITDPLLHETKYKYDGDGNLEVKTDPELHETTYTFDADNEQTKVKEPNGTVTETGYDGAGKVTSQTDGNKNETKYIRNILEQVTEVVDPKERKTTKEYDAAGNLKALTDPAKRTTTYTYDAANRPKEISYSDGKTPAVKYEYNSDNKRTKMTDGTGTTTYGYDQLDRLAETENGHKEKVKYEYDLANEQTKITYPNTKAVTREYDNAGRLKSVKDWAEHTTKFGYDADSNLTTTTFPTGTSNVDTYAYDETDAMKEVKMAKGAETLASLVYTRNKDGQVKGATSKGLPGEEKPAYEYDTNSRLAKGATISYKYDAANNPTTIGSGTYKYDKASELETGPSLTYTYDELGDRTKTKPTTGPTTTYGYDQAENLTTVERPKEGEKAEIKDTYAYNGDGLRASQTISGTTTYMAWEEGVPLPLLLTDGTNNYIYGPGGLPIEQISATTTLYLHHDQQGSTRLLTNSTGTKEASFTYDAYGNQTGHTGTATTPLGYDAQYTSGDTGLIYLRARVYDPATAQFLSVDPAVESTRELYAYATNDPVNRADPTGKEWTASQFSHAYFRELSRLRRTAKRLHIDLEKFGLYEDYALTGYYAIRFNMDYDNTADYHSWNSYYNITVKHTVSALAPLALSLDTATSPSDLIKTLAKVAASVFGI